MANYFVPRVQIEQEFTQNLAFTTKPLSALIVGPQYKLCRYASEKLDTLVLEAVSPSTNANTYVGTQRDYTYQSKDPAATIDLSYLKVYLDNAELEYYSTASVVTVDSVNRNQVSSASQIYKTGYGNTRTTAADVIEGDKIILADAASSPTVTLTTKVRSVIASKTSATVPATATPVAGGATEDVDISVKTSGTFTGTKDITYRIVVTQGGAYGAATVKVLSDNVDSSGPFIVSNSTGTAHSPKYALGTQGLYFDFVPVAPSTDVLVTGNEWTVKIVAPTFDKFNILELEDNLPTGWAGYYVSSIRLIETGVAIPAIRDLNAGTTNWVATQAGIQLKSAIQGTNSRVAVSGVLTSLDVKTAKIYVERRDLVKANTTLIGNVTSLGSIETSVGTIHPDNDLAQGVYNAMLNSSGSTVYFVGVATNDVAGYTKALELAKKDKAFHGVVPLTDNAEVIALFTDHVTAMSDSKQAKWREVFFGRSVADSKTIYGSKPSNGNQWTAYVSVIPGGSAFSYVTVGYDNGSALVPDTEAKLLTDGIRAGDKFLYNFRIDSITSEVIHDEATIVAATAQNTLIVDKDWGAAQSTPFKAEIRRDYTSSEKAAAYKTVLASYNDRRFIPVFPDTYKAGTVTQKGYHLAAAVAGLASGVAPHQSLTNLQVLGPTDLTRVVSDFNETDLDALAEEGCLIITQASIGSAAYVRHQLTSDHSVTSKAENSITRNVDSISYALQDALAPFVGIYNINAGSLLKVRAAIDKELNFRLSGTATITAGPQLLGYEIVKVDRDTLLKDKLVIEVKLTVPYPMNYITVSLIV